MKKNLLNDSGFGLIQMLVLALIISATTMILIRGNEIQMKESKIVQLVLARADTERVLENVFTQPKICELLLGETTDVRLKKNRNQSFQYLNLPIALLDNAPKTAHKAFSVEINKIPIAPDEKIFSILSEFNNKENFVAIKDGPSSSLSEVLTIKKMEFIIYKELNLGYINSTNNFAPKNVVYNDNYYYADFQVTFNEINDLPTPPPLVMKTIQIETIKKSSSPYLVDVVSCGELGKPRPQRIIFTNKGIPKNPTDPHYKFKVPPGLTKAFLSIAGGGSSGSGWRISNRVYSGHSGGFLVSYPIDLVPGSTINVYVGKGGKGYGPKFLKTPIRSYYGANPVEPLDNATVKDSLGRLLKNYPYLWGTTGYPGEYSYILDTTKVNPKFNIFCTGGAGAFNSGADSFDDTSPEASIPPGAGGTVNSNYLVGSGIDPIFPLPFLPFTYPNGFFITKPTVTTAATSGVCGYDEKTSNHLFEGETGNSGEYNYEIDSGFLTGGYSPLGYGSGGSVSVDSECPVSSVAFKVGVCVTPQPAKDGIVILDVY